MHTVFSLNTNSTQFQWSQSVRSIHSHAGLFALALASKLAGEWTISWLSARRYGRTDLLPWFPLWFIAQIPYIVWVGMLGTFGNFRWKDRKHGAAL